MLKVAVMGASGRMGKMLIEAVEAAEDCTLHVTLDKGDDVRTGLTGADVMIDFTRPEATLAHLAVCADLGVKAVVGTTGFDDAQKAEIARFAERTAIVKAALDGLEQQTREVFLRYYYYNQPIREIALATGLSETAVKSRLLRGRKKLKEQLTEGGYLCED